MKATKIKIEKWFEENYGSIVKYDKIKFSPVDRNRRHFEVQNKSVRIAQFEGNCLDADRYFKEARIHLNWTFSIK